MSDKLIIQHPNLPLRGYTKDKLEIEMDKFMQWVTNLLGLRGEESARRLVTALPAIEKHFYSLGFIEIQKAFEMYADGELITKPIPNYFDRILVGQIFKEYRQQKPIKTPVVTNKEISDGEKEEIIKAGVIRCENEYKEFGMVLPGNQHIYDYLDEKGIINVPNERKKDVMAIAALNLKKSSSMLEKYVKSEARTTAEAKRLLLEEYFEYKTNKK